MRRQLITHPKFQFTYTLSLVMGVVVIFAFIGLASAGALHLLSKDPLLDPDQVYMLKATAQTMAWKLALACLGTCVLFVFLGIYMSYKSIGPVLRIENWLLACLEKKKCVRFTVRPGDEFEQIVDQLSVHIGEKYGVEEEGA